jgi:hypothetical protein
MPVGQLPRKLPRVVREWLIKAVNVYVIISGTLHLGKIHSNNPPAGQALPKIPNLA